MKLSELKQSQSGIISVVGGEGNLRGHFLDMGIIPGTKITMLKLLQWEIPLSTVSGDMN